MDAKYTATVLLNAVQEAGNAILALQKTSLTVTTKANNDIVTKADLVANDMLKNKLLTQFPHDGWLSEESADDLSRLNSERVWIVDPIDGTREYAEGMPEYAISVALVERGEPVVAAVYNPAMSELYYAIQGQGAFLNNEPINCQAAANHHLLLLASRSEFRRGEWDKYHSKHTVKKIGSIAYKLALIAAGNAQATFSLGPKNEWDIAAGTLLVSEAGGIVTNKHKEKLKFNRQNVLVDGIVATAVENNEYIFTLIHN